MFLVTRLEWAFFLVCDNSGFNLISDTVKVTCCCTNSCSLVYSKVSEVWTVVLNELWFLTCIPQTDTFMESKINSTIIVSIFLMSVATQIINELGCFSLFVLTLITLKVFENRRLHKDFILAVYTLFPHT